jgi:hypothetical protein
MRAALNYNNIIQGFKRNSSTNLCSMVLKETLSYYINNQTPVFCTFMDASKAFDRIHYCKLFKLLIKRKLPPCIIRIIMNLYTHNFLRVAWGSAITDYFSAVNGVKQGAVLSPVLFCVYLDGLLIAGRMFHRLHICRCFSVRRRHCSYRPNRHCYA